MSITYRSGKAIADLAVGSLTWTPPATWYLGLLTSTGLSISGTYTELSGSGYARVAVANDKAQWTTANIAAPTSITNVNVISFPESLADWTGTAVYLGFFDASTPSTGNLWFFDALSTSVTVVVNTTVYFNPGGINIVMNNS